MVREYNWYLHSWYPSSLKSWINLCFLAYEYFSNLYDLNMLCSLNHMYIFYDINKYLIMPFIPSQTNFPEMMNRYKQLLTYIRSAVTRNYSEKSINSILDYISTSKQVRFCFSLLILIIVFIIYIKGFVLCSFFFKSRSSI